MLEKEVEKALVKRVKAIGGFCMIICQIKCNIHINTH